MGAAPGKAGFQPVCKGVQGGPWDLLSPAVRCERMDSSSSTETERGEADIFTEIFQRIHDLLD